MVSMAILMRGRNGSWVVLSCMSSSELVVVRGVLRGVGIGARGQFFLDRFIDLALDLSCAICLRLRVLVQVNTRCGRSAVRQRRSALDVLWVEGEFVALQHARIECLLVSRNIEIMGTKNS